MDNKPNIVYILTDDQGYGDLSCLNPESRISTPHTDRMAREGICFRDAHATSAVCTPSRYSILTGRYNWRSRLKQGVVDGYAPPVIEPERMTVASLLKEQGYRTACLGKWHLGWDWARSQSGTDDDIDYTQPISNGPLSCGFDEFYGFSGSLDMPPYVWVNGNQPTAVPDQVISPGKGMGFWREGPIAPDFRHEDVLPELFRRATEHISQKAKMRPTLFSLSSATGSPYAHPPPFGKPGALRNQCLRRLLRTGGRRGRRDSAGT